MPRMNAVAAGITVVLAIGLAEMTAGQVTQNATGSKSTDGEKKNDSMKNGPDWLMNRSDWERMHQSNASYHASLTRVRQEMDRFKNDTNWSGMLLQVLGTEYSWIGRYRKSLDCFDSVYRSRRKQPAQLVDADRFEPCDAVAAILDLADKHR